LGNISIPGLSAFQKISNIRLGWFFVSVRTTNEPLIRCIFVDLLQHIQSFARLAVLFRHLHTRLFARSFLLQRLELLLRAVISRGRFFNCDIDFISTETEVVGGISLSCRHRINLTSIQLNRKKIWHLRNHRCYLLFYLKLRESFKISNSLICLGIGCCLADIDTTFKLLTTLFNTRSL
jgi:hypothetical protein